MLLFCCFGDGKKQKKKKEIQNNILQGNEVKRGLFRAIKGSFSYF